MAGFADLSPGDETHRYAQYFNRPAGEDLYAGEAVTLNAAGEFVKVAANGTDQVAGYCYINATAGEEITVKASGSGISRVELDAAVGGTVGSHDGTAANVDAGELSTVGDEYLVLEVGTKENPDGSGPTEYAEVLKL